jgi:hypothetical protein
VTTETGGAEEKVCAVPTRRLRAAHVPGKTDRQNQGIGSGIVNTLKNQYAVKVGDLQRVQIPPGQSVARPEATRAAQEVTNVLKYSGDGSL